MTVNIFRQKQGEFTSRKPVLQEMIKGSDARWKHRSGGKKSKNMKLKVKDTYTFFKDYCLLKNTVTTCYTVERT